MAGCCQLYIQPHAGKSPGAKMTRRPNFYPFYAASNFADNRERLVGRIN